MANQIISPATGPASGLSSSDPQIAVSAAMASCEADGHKCSCKQFGWQFSPHDPQQCNARLGAAYAALDAVRPIAPDLGAQGEPVATFPQGAGSGTYFRRLPDNTWVYLNHAGEWQGCATPRWPEVFGQAPAPPRPADREEIAKLIADAAGKPFDPTNDFLAYLSDPKTEDWLRAADAAILALCDAPRNGVDGTQATQGGRR